MKLVDYEYLWRDRHTGWALCQVEQSGYAIVNTRDRTSLIIEDDELYEAVIQEMVKHDVPVVSLNDLDD